MKIFAFCFFLSQFSAVVYVANGVQGFPIGGSIYPRRELINTTASEVDILLDFKRRVRKDPSGVLSNWNVNASNPCSWRGVECDGQKRVWSLLLDNQDLQGTLSPMLGGLVFMEVINLAQNRFEGVIPPELGGMRSMRTVNLRANYFSGTIPASLANLSRMQTFIVRENYLTGGLAMVYSGELTMFNVGGNNLSGNIPSEFGNMKKLETLYVWKNSLSGAIPSSLGNLSTLQILSMSYNQLTGEIPPAFGSLRSMRMLLIDHNPLTDRIPAFLGNLSALEFLYLDGSQLSGTIPAELGALRNLQRLHVGGNNLTGMIPASIGNCQNLTEIGLAENALIGPIPPSMGNLTQLQEVNFSNNRLSGSIPPEIAACSLLASFTLSNNMLNGSIPRHVWARIGVSLKILQLDRNRLTGEIPSGLSATTDLQLIDLSHNSLSGNIPAQVIGNLAKAGRFLNLSHNNLTGPIPPEIGNLVSIQEIDLSMNQLVGEIPFTLQNCRGLIRLDLSRNFLEGNISEAIGSLPSLSFFNVSYNELGGPIPDTGSFLNFTNNSYIGNGELCGAVVQKACPKASDLPESPASSTSRCTGLDCEWARVGLSVGLIGLIAVASAACCLYLRWRWWRSISRLQNQSKAPTIFDKQFNTSVMDIRIAIDNLRSREASYLGVGGNSTVYRVELSGSQTVALKVLKFDHDHHKRNLKSMIREVEILGQLRHRNLVKLLGVCFTESFKVLVLEYMANGNLSSWLHDPQYGRNLKWKTRLDIAVGVASAMTHLHHGAQHPVIHRDLKPSNILLDADFVAKVSDFGLAKIVEEGLDDDTEPTVSSALAYTTGYAAPEYGTSFQSSTKGDIYAFGVVILELLTGAKPTDSRFDPETTLVSWVTEAFPKKLTDVLDNSLRAEFESDRSSARQMHNVMLLAILCTDERPQLRPTMQDVLPVLMDIENDCLGIERSSMFGDALAYDIMIYVLGEPLGGDSSFLSRLRG